MRNTKNKVSEAPIIGYTPGLVENLRSATIKIYGQSVTYTEAIWRAGGFPLQLPLHDDETAVRRALDMCDGLMLPGGTDIDPALYEQAAYPGTDEPDSLRDAVELRYIRYALEKDMPQLLICRGMQLLNVHFGGELYQDIPTDIPTATTHHSETNRHDIDITDHPIKLVKGSKLHRILGADTVETNTYHHQAIKTLGKGLRASAWSEDGLIEGLETDDDRFIIAVQSHPESLITNDEVPEWRLLFRELVTASDRYRLASVPAELTA